MTWLALTLSVYAALMCAAATCYAVWFFTCGRTEPDEPDGEQVASDFLEQQAQANHGQAVERLQREGEEIMKVSRRSS